MPTCSEVSSAVQASVEPAEVFAGLADTLASFSREPASQQEAVEFAKQLGLDASARLALHLRQHHGIELSTEQSQASVAAALGAPSWEAVLGAVRTLAARSGMPPEA
jgi:hypothetical protein